MKKKKVNITIVTYNRLECTKRCLESIFKTAGFPFVLNIIDNGSIDGTPRYLQELRSHVDASIVNVVLLKRNMGVSVAYNLGWDQCPADYYMKIDNDVEFIREGWLAELVAVADAVDDVAMVGIGQNTSGLTHKQYDGPQTLYYQGHIGGLTLIRADIFERLGFWCEDYGLYGEEDADYGLRARLAGFCNLTIGDADTAYFRYTEDIDENLHEYQQWKSEERAENIKFIFAFNDMLYKCKLRELYMPRRVIPQRTDSGWTFRPNREYLINMAELENKYRPLMGKIIASEEFRVINEELGFNFYY
jgi:GT2 family glycosyltransferase